MRRPHLSGTDNHRHRRRRRQNVNYSSPRQSRPTTRSQSFINVGRMTNRPRRRIDSRTPGRSAGGRTDAKVTVSPIRYLLRQCRAFALALGHLPPPCTIRYDKKGKGSPYSIAEGRVPELIPVLGSQPAGNVSHKPGGGMPLLSARLAVTPATLKRAATNFAAW